MDAQQGTRRREINALFIEPPAEYGPFAWYWLNGESVDLNRVREQLKLLHEHGFGGVTLNYTHTVLGGSYLGDPAVFTDEWWAMLLSIIAECKKLDMRVGFDDYLVTHGRPEHALIGRKILANYSDVSGWVLRETHVKAQPGDRVKVPEMVSADQIITVSADALSLSGIAAQEWNHRSPRFPMRVASPVSRSPSDRGTFGCSSLSMLGLKRQAAVVDSVDRTGE